MSEPGHDVRFPADRVARLLESLERLAAGDTRALLTLSPRGDELDAIAFGINVLADELRWRNAQMTEAERVRADDMRRSKEAAERASEAKSVFVRNASHEIRTPIAVILILAELLARPDVANEERAELARQLRSNCQSVLSLVSNLLDLSRLEAGRPALTIETVSPFELVHEVVESLEPQARRKGLTVRVDVEGTIPVAVATDELRLRQILVNVIGNALKFTETGTVSVVIGLDASAPEESLRFDVTDTGSGIAADQRDALFEPFGQTSSPGTHGGTGLGLAISRHLAEHLAGTLELVHSAPAQGSTFRLVIKAPRVDRTQSEIAAVLAAGSELPLFPLTGVRILFADDRPDLQVAVRRLLRSMGAWVDCAKDGREAIAMATSKSYDIVLMDLLMPEVDGLEAVRSLRSTGCELPIIAITADATTARRQEAKNAGCDALLSKPFDSQHLLASIDVLLRRRREGQAVERS